MSADQVVDHFAPKEETINAVTKWLISEGIEYDQLALSANKQWIKFDAASAKVERLLHAQFHLYLHRKTGEQGVATEEYDPDDDGNNPGPINLTLRRYSVPRSVQQHIDYILPGTLLRSTRRERKSPSMRQHKEQLEQRSGASQFANCTTKGMTPQCIAGEYKENHQTFRQPMLIHNAAIYNIPEASSAVAGNAMGFYEADSDIFYQKDFNLYTAKYYP